MSTVPLIFIKESLEIAMTAPLSVKNKILKIIIVTCQAELLN